MELPKFQNVYGQGTAGNAATVMGMVRSSKNGW